MAQLENTNQTDSMDDETPLEEAKLPQPKLLDPYIRGIEKGCSGWASLNMPDTSCSIPLEEFTFKKINNNNLDSDTRKELLGKELLKLGGQSLYLSAIPETIRDPKPIIFLNGLIKMQKDFLKIFRKPLIFWAGP